MTNLYLYKCKPNYPVISDAMVMFVSVEPPSKVHWPNLLIEGRTHAENFGCTNAGKDETVIYIGKLDPCKTFSQLPVILVITGEY